ncbi:MAG: alpha/beta hydrolase [Neisseriales bacterium]|nr:MAG: alpha/beta hydrolase [Neisseriales bacterium]
MAVLPKIQELLDNAAILKQKLAAVNFKPNQTNVREALAMMTAKYMTDIDYSIFAIDDTVLNGFYPVPVRTYVPNLTKALPVAVFIHGGGHMAGSVTVYDGIVRKLAKTTGHIIVSVDYRLAPEFAYPTGIEDAKAVIRNVFAILDERKIKYLNKDLSIIGDSGGGAFCASIVMDKEFVAMHSIKKQVLIYPSLDYTCSLPSTDTFGEGYLLEKSKMQYYFRSYFQNGEGARQVSPLHGEFYANMPKTMVIVAEFDPLVDEGILYQKYAAQVGVDSELLKVSGVVHAYLMLENLCPDECNNTYQEISKFLLK